jgi:predicted enzyme related to lactoylglutathione lyase
MITGAHWLIYSKDPEADRAFFRDALHWKSVDAGHGWLIFKSPPGEVACHPADTAFVQRHAEHELLGVVLYLMCDDVKKTIKELEAKGVKCTAVEQAPWGFFSIIGLPSGGSIGLYQPTHPTAIDLA